MKVRIQNDGIRYVLCVGYRREVGVKARHPESFLFFSPEMPDDKDQEGVMLAIGESMVSGLKGKKVWGLVGCRRLDFKENNGTMAAEADYSDVFGLECGWSELIDQRKSFLFRLGGESGQNGKLSWLSYVRRVLFPPPPAKKQKGRRVGKGAE